MARSAGVHFVTRWRVGGTRVTFGTYAVRNVTRTLAGGARVTKCTPDGAQRQRIAGLRCAVDVWHLYGAQRQRSAVIATDISLAADEHISTCPWSDVRRIAGTAARMHRTVPKKFVSKMSLACWSVVSSTLANSP